MDSVPGTDLQESEFEFPSSSHGLLRLRQRLKWFSADCKATRKSGEIRAGASRRPFVKTLKVSGTRKGPFGPVSPKPEPETLNRFAPTFPKDLMQSHLHSVWKDHEGVRAGNGQTRGLEWGWPRFRASWKHPFKTPG